MTVRLRCYARIADVVGQTTLERSLPSGATVADAYAALAQEFDGLADLRSATRFVRGDAFVTADAELCDGDELGLLPPYGGG